MRIVKKLRKKSQRILDEDPIDQEVSRFISWLDELPEEITVQELEPLLIETIKINRKGWRLPDLIKYLSRQSAQHPMISIRLLYRAMKNDSITPRHFYSGKEEEIGQILTNAIKTDKPEAYYYADYIVNTFGEWGNYYFKDFWMEYLKGKKVKRIVKISRK